MFDVIILLGGIGERCHLPYNKIFHKVNDKTLFKYSLDTFLLTNANKIILVIKDEDKNFLENELLSYNDKRIVITTSGKTRQESVNEGMKKVESEYVLIHDGARPNVSLEDINNIANEVKKSSSCLLARKAKETIKESILGKVKTLNRDNLWIAETPQAVKSDIFKKALEKALIDNYTATDDVSLLEKYYEINSIIIPSTTYNLKITTMEDFLIFKEIIKNTH